MDKGEWSMRCFLHRYPLAIYHSPLFFLPHPHTPIPHTEMKALDTLSTLYEASGQTDKAVAAHRALQAPSSR